MNAELPPFKNGEHNSESTSTIDGVITPLTILSVGAGKHLAQLGLTGACTQDLAITSETICISKWIVESVTLVSVAE